MAPSTIDDSRIPIIDFSPFLDGTKKQEVADKMLTAFKDIGFIYLINHGIPQERIAQMFEMSKTFFAQPMEIKELAPHPTSGTQARGYSAPGQEKVTQHVYDRAAIAALRAQAPDAKESFECGREGDPVMPNIWLPDGVLPGFKEICLDFFWLCYDIELNILRALALGFGLPEEYFVTYHAAADNQLRLLHYPSVPLEALEKETIARVGQHSDFGSITLLLQDDVGGLEVEDPHAAGSFWPARPIPGALVVNAGDLMMRWSNDTIRALSIREGPAAHRDFSSVVDCIPGTWDEARPKKYEPISAKEYFLKRLRAIY
ncbi:thymine dioxygenase [Mycena leptocephala]|nr:thymine dioxygenase [Mycena leptocephala]